MLPLRYRNAQRNSARKMPIVGRRYEIESYKTPLRFQQMGLSTANTLPHSDFIEHKELAK